MNRLQVVAATTMLLAGCGSGGGAGADAAGETAAEARGEAGAEAGSDVMVEAVEISPDATTGDAGDAAADEAADWQSDRGIGPCQVKQGRLIPEGEEPTKFQLSVFHFNIQYVAGGLVGFMDRPGLSLTEAEVEDRVVTQSLVPLLDILDAHPTWGFDIEMQGYMLDVMRERHGDVLARMRKLVENGQVHVDSFHWSDQLWTAHPVVSMERSFALNEQSFAQACLPLGGAVFTQEGQFGEGLALHVRDSGRVGLLPTNLFKYLYGSNPVKLVYDLDGTRVAIAGRGVADKAGDKDVEVEWHFMNDGELACTGNGNPYFGEAFAYDPAFTKTWVEDLEQKEAEGWRVATVAEYVGLVTGYGCVPAPLPVIVDGTWQPSETGNVHRWMGLIGGFGDTEDDNGVLAAVTRSRIALQAAEVVAKMLGEGGRDVEAAWSGIEEGWRHQLWAEVSDATGWNPWKGEVEYGFEHSAAALDAAGAALDAVVNAEDLYGTIVNTGLGTMTRALPFLYYEWTPGGKVEAVTEPLEGAAPALAVTVDAQGWDCEEQWTGAGTGEGLSLLRLVFTPAGEPGAASRNIAVTFPRDGDEIVYVPALTEGEKKVREVDVGMFELAGAGALPLPLANGLIGMSEGRWIVSVNALNHVAAVLPQNEEVITFDNRSQPVPKAPDDAFEWMFVVIAGLDAASAVAVADYVNVHPTVMISELPAGSGE